MFIEPLGTAVSDIWIKTKNVWQENWKKNVCKMVAIFT